jgi:hypothetical protein
MLRLTAIICVLSVLAVVAVAAAAKPRASLSFELLSTQTGQVVDYAVERKTGGNQDLAIHHQCFADGALVYDFTNRIYWDDAARKSGSWNIGVESGRTCTAEVVDVADSSVASNTVSYTVP